jgi:hypothetical protein
VRVFRKGGQGTRQSQISPGHSRRIRADSEAPPDIREVSSVWLFAKDGRHFVRNPEIAVRIIRK